MSDKFTFLLPLVMSLFGLAFLIVARFGGRASACWGWGYLSAALAFAVPMFIPLLPLKPVVMAAEALFFATFLFYGHALLGHGRCSAFTYNVRQRACFLKGMATEALQYSGAVSGYVGSPTDITRVGRDFGPSLGFRTSREVEIVAKPFARIPNSSLSACQDQCVVSGRCQGFSFYRSGICLMFDVRKPTRRNLLSVAGTRSN